MYRCNTPGSTPSTSSTFDFPYHHTTEDTIDKVSAESLQIVGDVAMALVSPVKNKDSV